MLLDHTPSWRDKATAKERNENTATFFYFFIFKNLGQAHEVEGRQADTGNHSDEERLKRRLALEELGGHVCGWTEKKGMPSRRRCCATVGEQMEEKGAGEEEKEVDKPKGRPTVSLWARVAALTEKGRPKIKVATIIHGCNLRQKQQSRRHNQKGTVQAFGRMRQVMQTGTEWLGAVCLPTADGRSETSTDRARVVATRNQGHARRNEARQARTAACQGPATQGRRESQAQSAGSNSHHPFHHGTRWLALARKKNTTNTHKRHRQPRTRAHTQVTTELRRVRGSTGRLPFKKV